MCSFCDEKIKKSYETQIIKKILFFSKNRLFWKKNFEKYKFLYIILLYM